MITTNDLGLAIRDHIEDHDVNHYDGDVEVEGAIEYVNHVDVSDANNPRVYLSNGQKFIIRIIAV